MRETDGLAQQAASQYGLLTTVQLREMDVTESRQRWLQREGLLRRVEIGVVALAGAPETWMQRMLAPILARGEGLVASHRSALRLWGLQTRWEGLEFSVPYPRNRTVAGGTVHRSLDLCTADVVERDGLAVTNVERTLCDAGVHYPPRLVQRMVDHSISTGLVTADSLRSFRQRVARRGRRGVAPLGAALDGLPAGSNDTKSSGEMELLRLIAACALPLPERQHELVVDGRRYLIDLSYPIAKLALEYDGREPHTRHDRFVDDRRRQNDIVIAGWTVLRYTFEDLRDRPRSVERQIRQLLDL